MQYDLLVCILNCLCPNAFAWPVWLSAAWHSRVFRHLCGGSRHGSGGGGGSTRRATATPMVATVTPVVE